MARTPGARFGPRRLLHGHAASRATTTMVDQCLASASNVAVGIVVARISGPAGLGAFALAYTVWILATTLHRSLITDPMAIMGDMRGEQQHEFVRKGFAADVTLGLMFACIIAAVGSALLAVGQHTFGIGLLAVAPWIIVLDLQDYWRWIGFMQGTPKKSLKNDLLFNAVQAAAFALVFLLGLRSVFAVVSAWGLGAAVAAIYGLWQFRLVPSLRGGRAFLWSRWPTSRWLASERAASWGASQLYLILAGVILGPAALGGLKAAQGLVIGPTSVVVNAGGSFGLPEATRQLAERGWSGMMKVSRLVSGAGVAAATAWGLVILVAAPTFLRIVYGPAFVAYAPCARLFAVSIVIYAFGVGPMISLTATRRVRPLFVVQLGRLVLAVSAVSLLSVAYGATGAAGADLLTSVATTVAIFVLQSWARRSGDEAPGISGPGLIRKRLMRNAEFLLLPPNRSAARPPKELPDSYSVESSHLGRSATSR
jgi:O-antigen/teichoic acid export membrane protein